MTEAQRAEAMLAAYERHFAEYLDAHPISPIADRAARVEIMRLALADLQSPAPVGWKTEAFANALANKMPEMSMEWSDDLREAWLRCASTIFTAGRAAAPQAPPSEEGKLQTLLEWATGPDDRDPKMLTNWQRGYLQAQRDAGALLTAPTAPPAPVLSDAGEGK